MQLLEGDQQPEGDLSLHPLEVAGRQNHANISLGVRGLTPRNTCPETSKHPCLLPWGSPKLTHSPQHPCETRRLGGAHHGHVTSKVLPRDNLGIWSAHLTDPFVNSTHMGLDLLMPPSKPQKFIIPEAKTGEL